MPSNVTLTKTLFSHKGSLVFLIYGRILIFFISFVFFLFFYLLKPFFIHWPMLLKTYVAFGILFSFYLYILFFIKKHCQNKLWFWFGLCLDSLALTVIMHFSNLPASWFLSMYMLHIILIGILYHHYGVLYLSCLSSVLFNGVGIQQNEYGGSDPSWLLFSIMFYHFCFFALAKTSLYIGSLFKQFMKNFKQTHRALNQMRGFNQWILQNIPAGLVTCDALGHILQINNMASKILNLPKSNLMGKPIQVFFPFCKSETKKAYRRKVLRVLFQ